MSGEYNFINCVMSTQYNPDFRLELPSGFVDATEKWLILRECWCSIMNAHLPLNSPGDDVLLYASFVDDMCAHRFVCLSNSPNLKKKKFRVRGHDRFIEIWFQTINGERIHPEQYLLDFLLKFKA